MSVIEIWLRQPAAQAIGWALVQFLWQGAAIGVVAALALAALRRSAADVRYVVSSIALALMLTLPVVTGVQRYQALRGQAASQGATAFRNGVAAGDGFRMTLDRIGISGIAGSPAPFGRQPIAPRPIDWTVVIDVAPVVWSVGVLLLTLRLLTGWVCAQRLRTHGVTPADEPWRAMTARLARRLHIARAVTLLESSLVDVPTVIGFLKPVVLLPASTIAGLTPQQVEAILAHELAHVRRHDYLVNLVQTLVETILFYHPAVWWLSGRLRVEREHCCDDLAVSLCGDPVTYAAALADLEALRSSDPLRVPRIAMAATGGSLLLRIRRLLGAPSPQSSRGPAWLAGTVALLLAGGIAASAQRDQSDPGSPRPVVAVPHTTAVMANAPAIARPSPLSTSASAPAVAAASASVPAVASAAAPPATPTPALAGASAAATAAAAASSAASQQVSVSRESNRSSGSWSWSHDGDKLEVSYDGSFEFTDDDSDVRQLSAGGWLKVSDGRWLGRHSVEIKERNGALERRYYVNAAERPFEPEGRAWLHENLPRFIKNSGFGADARVARLLKSGGPAAVLSEIGRLESGYVQGVYFRELFKQGSLTPDQYREAMTVAARGMRSSPYELAQLLVAVADKLPADEASRAAYFQAAAAVASDYDRRRVYSAMLKRGPVSSAILGEILTSARSIGSDYDLSELLRQLLAQQTIDDRNRDAFFAAVATIGGSYERHRVLSAVLSGQRPTDPALLAGALTSATHAGGDYETSQFLQDVLRRNSVEGTIRTPFFTAVDTIGGEYERGRVLQDVVRRSGADGDTLRAVLQSSRKLSGYELSQLLQLVARTQPLTGDLRDVYVAAANRLGEYEQTQALAALVRSERRQ
ncbi:MAG TPA: M56 family metallopeptidase [Vicinamibacterales bacterium]|jgi:beta-lactamase regulating signal transducer with metallopeptidase domain